MDKTGFADCVPVIRNHFITGRDLAEAEPEFFYDTLGIAESDRRVKLKLELKRVMEHSISQEFELFGWGLNLFCQLGYEALKVGSPSKMALPQLFAQEEIVELCANKKNSLIFTSLGRVFIMGGQRYQKLNAQQRQQQPRFRDITGALNMNGEYNIVEICPNHDGAIGLVYRKCSGKIGSGKQKMKVGSKILHNIIYSTKFDASDFAVGYLDRFLGILEIPATEFYSSEIPKHRIQYFKKGADIVWDRRTRIDLI